MNRLAVAGLTASVVIGALGGTYAASAGVFEGNGDPGQGQRGPEQNGSEQSGPEQSGPEQSGREPTDHTGSPTPTGNSSPTAGSDGLFFMEGETIHDGSTQVQVSGLEHEVTALHRVDGGWLVVERVRGDSGEKRATFVDADGTTTEIGSFTGDHDVDRDGESIIAVWEGDEKYQVRDARTGSTTATLDEDLPGKPEGGATFGVGEMAVTVWVDDADVHRLVAWDVGTNTTYPMQPDFRAVVGAAQGNQIVARRESDPMCVKSGPILRGTTWWGECGISPDFLPRFSPSGDALVALSNRTTGAGDTTFLVLDADTGDTEAKVKAPDYAQAAEWDSEESLLVRSFRDESLDGGRIDRCSLGGDCELLLESDEPVVLGRTG